MAADQLSEIEKCKRSPHYFAKNYCHVKGGQNPAEHMSEELYNNLFKIHTAYGFKRIAKGR